MVSIRRVKTDMIHKLDKNPIPNDDNFRWQRHVGVNFKCVRPGEDTETYVTAYVDAQNLHLSSAKNGQILPGYTDIMYRNDDATVQVKYRNGEDVSFDVMRFSEVADMFDAARKAYHKNKVIKPVSMMNSDLLPTEFMDGPSVADKSIAD